MNWEIAIKPENAGGYVQRKWQEWGDFFVSNWQVVKSKMNSASYTSDQVDQDVEQWHLDLATKERGKPSEEFSIALTLDHLGGGWKGWKWVSLERGYCDAEAQAMGHCGNSGHIEGDNILSLRDQEGWAHLTFVVNNKILGESKGRANSKPVARYHPAIMELLKSDWVGAIQGGGYKPENNFAFSDLSKESQKEVLQSSPHINDWIEYAMQSDPWLVFSKLYLTKENNPHRVDDTFVLATFEDVEELDEFVKGDLKAYFGEDSWEVYDSYYQVKHWSDFDFYVDDELEKMIMQFAKENELEAESPSEVFDESDDVQMVMQNAVHDGNSSGASSEAWKILMNSMRHGDEGFSVEMTNHPWRLTISKDNLKEFMTDNEDQLNYHEDLFSTLHELGIFKFEPPYNGFTDFDEEAFLERAKDGMYELLGTYANQSA